MNKIMINGKAWSYKMGVGAMVRAERITGVSFLGSFTPTLELMIALGFSAIHSANRDFDMSYEDFIDALESDDIEQFTKAFEEVMPADKKGTKKKTVSKKSS